MSLPSSSSRHFFSLNFRRIETSLLPALLHSGSEHELFAGETADLLEEDFQIDDASSQSLADVVDGVLGGVLLGEGVEQLTVKGSRRHDGLVDRQVFL